MRQITDNTYYLDKEDIYTYLKNRPPMLFIEEVYIEPGKRAYTTKILEKDEWYFACHFPGMPMMPGVLQLETLFQTSAMAIKVLEGYKDKTTNIAQINNVKYRKQILPEMEIKVNTEVLRFRRGLATIKGEILVEDEVCCEAEYVLVVLDDMIKI